MLGIKFRSNGFMYYNTFSNGDIYNKKKKLFAVSIMPVWAVLLCLSQVYAL